jgi:integrase
MAPQAREKHQSLLTNQIKPGIGDLRVSEATTGRVDTFLKAVAKRTPALAHHCRTVLSGALGLAVRHDAIPANPVRETGTVARRKTEVRILSVKELNDLRAMVDRWQRGLDKKTGETQFITHPRATDLLDVTDMLAATGARIGEVLALRWAGIDLGDTSRRPTATISGAGFEWVTPHTFRRTVATLLDRERSTDDAARPGCATPTRPWPTPTVSPKAHRAPDVTDVLQQLQRPPTPPPAISL